MDYKPIEVFLYTKEGIQYINFVPSNRQEIENVFDRFCENNSTFYTTLHNSNIRTISKFIADKFIIPFLGFPKELLTGSGFRPYGFVPVSKCESIYQNCLYPTALFVRSLEELSIPFSLYANFDGKVHPVMLVDKETFSFRYKLDRIYPAYVSHKKTSEENQIALKEKSNITQFGDFDGVWGLTLVELALMSTPSKLNPESKQNALDNATLVSLTMPELEQETNFLKNRIMRV